LTTVQTNPNLAYYTMTGMENATGTIGGYNGYMREYVNHEFGAELDYGFSNDHFKSVNTLTLDAGREYVYGQYKYEPGTYRNILYGFTSHNSIKKEDVLHRFDLALKYETGSADEYKSERVTTTDGSTGYQSIEWHKILEYKKRYQLKKLDLDFHYRLSFVDNEAVCGYAGIQYTLQSASNKHLLYTSELKNAASLIQVEGGLPLFDHLWAEATAGYHFSHKADLQLYDATTAYAVGVLLPDMPYYEANYWQGRLQLTWQQPLTIKGYTTNWFARLYGAYLKTDNSLHANTAGLSIGVYY
jgi:hypothetical protein